MRPVSHPSTSTVRNGPYSRPDLPQPTPAPQQPHPTKNSSTTSEFTKRKNWSQHILDEVQVSVRWLGSGQILGSARGRPCSP